MADNALDITSARASAALYDQDFVAWANQTALLIRKRRFSEIDAEHVAEEIESMGISQERELLSRLTVLLSHLLKWRHQPERLSSSWRATIGTQRTELRRLLKRSPSLRRSLAESVLEVYADAAREASYETNLPLDTFPRECPFVPEQILKEDFLPD